MIQTSFLIGSTVKTNKQKQKNKKNKKQKKKRKTNTKRHVDRNWFKNSKLNRMDQTSIKNRNQFVKLVQFCSRWDSKRSGKHFNFTELLKKRDYNHTQKTKKSAACCNKKKSTQAEFQILGIMREMLEIINIKCVFGFIV